MEGSKTSSLEKEKPNILHQCICCGEKKESRSICGCPNCGCRMYPLPYDRKELLRREIREFIRRLELKEIRWEDLTVPEKKKDEARFPDFDRIHSYVRAAGKTEPYFERLSRSLEEIRGHFGKPFQKTYQVDLGRLRERGKRQEEVLGQALGKVRISERPEAAAFPAVLLEYREEPDPELFPAGEELLRLLEKLAEKMWRFIRQNNIYGVGFQEKGNARKKRGKDRDAKRELERAIENVSRTLQKRYEVDIFSDGSEELSEMNGCLWTSIRLFMSLPMLRKKEVYRFEDGSVWEGEAVLDGLARAAAPRYAKIDEKVFSEEFLSGRGEEELFSLYNEMIGLDCFGYMGLKESRLARPGESERQLNEMIGLTDIKESIKKIKAYALANRDGEGLNLHMCFYGNPGTGKTEVARMIAGILYENRILPSKKVVEVDRGGLVGQYVGETPQKTMQAIEAAMGGVLFIDEAYALVQEHEIYGKEAVATLLKAMEDSRGKFCVILAGYKNQMRQMLESNPGFRSRISFELDFPNYSREELGRIGEKMLRKRGYTMSGAAMSRMLDVADWKRREANFANAREIRNLLDQVIMCQNVRTEGTKDRELALVDVNRYLADSRIYLPTEASQNALSKILTGEEELERLAGLTSVKRMVKKIKAYAKRNGKEPDFNLHMCFYGNPGTGKTEVARILSRILYEAGVLAEAKLVETDSTGLIGQYVGETGPKTQAKIQEAMGGILFIDEAYALTQNRGMGGAGYGEEAIAALLKGMEDYRGRFCVILAGYQEEMREMLKANPGFESRIPFSLEFADYSREELGQIARSFLEKKRYRIEEDALERALDIAEALRTRPNFANARTMRNILDQVILNQNLRTEDSSEDFTVILEDVEEYIRETEVFSEQEARPRFGFGR